MANDWPTQSQEQATRQIQSDKGGPGSPATGSLLAGGTCVYPARSLCVVPLRSGRAPRAAALVVQVCTCPRREDLFFPYGGVRSSVPITGGPSPSSLAKSQESLATLITVIVESLPHPPHPSTRPQGGPYDHDAQAGAVK